MMPSCDQTGVPGFVGLTHFIDLLDESRYQALLAHPGLPGLELRALPAHSAGAMARVAAELIRMRWPVPLDDLG